MVKRNPSPDAWQRVHHYAFWMCKVYVDSLFTLSVETFRQLGLNSPARGWFPGLQYIQWEIITRTSLSQFEQDLTLQSWWDSSNHSPGHPIIRCSNKSFDAASLPPHHGNLFFSTHAIGPTHIHHSSTSQNSSLTTATSQSSPWSCHSCSASPSVIHVTGIHVTQQLPFFSWYPSIVPGWRSWTYTLTQQILLMISIASLMTISSKHYAYSHNAHSHIWNLGGCHPWGWVCQGCWWNYWEGVAYCCPRVGGRQWIWCAKHWTSVPSHPSLGCMWYSQKGI